MGSQPLVSVAMVAYNQEQFIQEAILSIINQTYSNIELIIVDDGSPDNTLKKIKETEKICKKRFVRLVVETQPNSGSCIALTKAYKLCKGKYIYDIAADDLAKPNAIEKCVSFLENHSDYGLCVSDNEIINDKSERIGWDKHRNAVTLSKALYKTFGEALQKENADIDFNSSRFGLYETFVTRNYIPNGYMIRKNIFEQIGKFTPEAPLEDWYMNLQISKYSKMKYLDEILFSYRWHDNNTVKRTEYMQKISYKTQLYEKKLVNSLKDKKWKKIFEQQINQIKMKFNFCNIIKYYKLKNMDTKQKILEIFGYKFIITDYKHTKNGENT